MEEIRNNTIYKHTKNNIIAKISYPLSVITFIVKGLNPLIKKNLQLNSTYELGGDTIHSITKDNFHNIIKATDKNKQTETPTTNS